MDAPKTLGVVDPGEVDAVWLSAVMLSACPKA
jgi:hypothetical protein